MGNATSCLAGGPVVKVMLPDATIETYDHAVQVAELAAMYPNYAVVHCSTEKPFLGQLRAVMIMKMEEFLVPGRAYILYPIPTSFDDSVRTCKNTDEALPPPQQQPSSDREGGGGEMKVSERGSGQRERLLTAEDLEKSLSQCLMGPAIRKKPSDDAVSVLLPDIGEKKDMEKERQRERERERDREKVKGRADFATEKEPCAWIPDLYQICED